jgi:hypothetical protein
VSMEITATDIADLTDDERAYLSARSTDGNLQAALDAYHDRLRVAEQLGEKYAEAGVALASLESRVEMASRTDGHSPRHAVFVKRAQ